MYYGIRLWFVIQERRILCEVQTECHVDLLELQSVNVTRTSSIVITP
jgi:hypothetical protein